MAIPTTTHDGGRNPVEVLAEEFLGRIRRGEAVTPEDYARDHPELADEILAVFPALVMVEGLGASSGGRTGSLTSAGGLAAGAASGRLGEFHLLREVGRGGMGVVYEAEQESLGRRVALKVLPVGALPDAKQVRRFEREARATARLHHTHIVPIFGVGQHDGTHFYVMQFIQGQGLDTVLHELKKLRDARSSRTPLTPAHTERQRAAADIARSLATGRFVAGAGEGNADKEAERLDPTVPWSGAPVRAHTQVVDPAAPDPSATGAASLSGDGTAITETDRRYARGVARVGRQVAEALAYAHGQGILHRDIKPSNLLLDKDGNVWVTDFGLAKAVGGEDLTHTGDIVGTVRYMAPERFQGQGDARADVYALGLTLYEMLALRPAFDASDRAALVRQVTQQDPPRLRRLNRSVPADLETIVHKAIAREPAQRYASAEALGEDLERFLDGRPIRARRVSPAERAWRWARRNPAVAGLLGAVAALLIAGLIGSTWAAVHCRRAAEGERLARLGADHARAEADHARADAQAAQRDADARRREAEASRAEAQRQSHAAEASFARARRAVDDAFTQVSESKLLAVPGLRTLRADLLGSALAYYEELLKEHGDDPTLKRDLLRTRLRVARVFSELGQTEKSRDSYRAAADGYERALRQRPDDPDLKAGLAEALFGCPPGADSAHVPHLQRVIALREDVLRARPGDLANRKALAVTLDALASELRSHAIEPVEAVAASERAASVYLELAEARPDDNDVFRGLMQSFNSIAVTALADDAQRLPLYQQAEAFGREALRLRPNDGETASFLAVSAGNVAVVLRRLGRRDEATAQTRASVETLRTLARENPDAPAVQVAYLRLSQLLADDLAE
jgi:tetratricopeptide (TPR) repeat protein